MTTRTTNTQEKVRRTILITLAILALTFLTTSAHASCFDRGLGPSSGGPRGMTARLSLATIPAHNTIVGLWDATYTTSDNQPFQESYDVWHSDGTEMESANVSPIGGNVCIGVWKLFGSQIHLHHVGWAFDGAGNLIGPFTVDDVLALGNRGNSYSGSFDFKQYDNGGNLLQEVTGTISATRIEVN